MFVQIRRKISGFSKRFYRVNSAGGSPAADGGGGSEPRDALWGGEGEARRQAPGPDSRGIPRGRGGEAWWSAMTRAMKPWGIFDDF